MPVFPRFAPLPALCGAVLLASALLPLPENGAILGLPSLCPFHNLSGLPCPGCGLTRAFIYVAHGQIATAFAYHPLGPLLFAAALFVFGSSLLQRPLPQISPRFWPCGALLILAYWGLRLGGVWPLPT